MLERSSLGLIVESWAKCAGRVSGDMALLENVVANACWTRGKSAMFINVITYSLSLIQRCLIFVEVEKVKRGDLVKEGNEEWRSIRSVTVAEAEEDGHIVRPFVPAGQMFGVAQLPVQLLQRYVEQPGAEIISEVGERKGE